MYNLLLLLSLGWSDIKETTRKVLLGKERMIMINKMKINKRPADYQSYIEKEKGQYIWIDNYISVANKINLNRLNLNLGNQDSSWIAKYGMNEAHCVMPW